MCHRSVLCLPVVPHQLLTGRVHNKYSPLAGYSTYLRFQLARLLCLFHNNRSAVGRSGSVQYIKMWSRLNCWLVRVSPTKMSQLMADRWSVRYVPVASVQLLSLTPPIDVQVYSLVYWHLLSSLSCVSSPMWRLLWQRARMTCAQDPLPLPPHTPPSRPCVPPRLIRIL